MFHISILFNFVSEGMACGRNLVYGIEIKNIFEAGMKIYKYLIEDVDQEEVDKR